MLFTYFNYFSRTHFEWKTFWAPWRGRWFPKQACAAARAFQCKHWDFFHQAWTKMWWHKHYIYILIYTCYIFKHIYIYIYFFVFQLVSKLLQVLFLKCKFQVIQICISGEVWNAKIWRLCLSAAISWSVAGPAGFRLQMASGFRVHPNCESKCRSDSSQLHWETVRSAPAVPNLWPTRFWKSMVTYSLARISRCFSAGSSRASGADGFHRHTDGFRRL